MPPTTPKRLLSLDALRGFDMFWIIGGERLFAGLKALTGWGIWKPFEEQMRHVPWHGFSCYDLIFPLFIFVSGVTMGLRARCLTGLSWGERAPHYRRAARRLLLLLVFGVVYNHGWSSGIPTDPTEVRFASVLGRIGFAWTLCALLVWHAPRRVQAWTGIGVLVGYWVLLCFIPVPGGQAGVLTPEGTWNAWVDQRLLFGKLYAKVYDPEGLLSHLPAAVNCLAGVYAGRLIRSSDGDAARAARGLAFAGVLCLGLGWLWHPWFPVNKELWTSSFVLVTCGWSLLLLAAFHWVIDGQGWHCFGRFFAVIGANAILAYLATPLIAWSTIVKRLVGAWIEAAPSSASPLLATVALLALQWVVLDFLYRRNIFLKV